MVSAGSDRTIRLWDIEKGQNCGVLTGHEEEIRSLSVSPYGRHSASACRDNTIKLWDLSSMTELETLKGHSGIVQSVAFSPKGDLLASGSQDNTVMLWNLRAKRRIERLSSRQRLNGVALSLDARYLVAAPIAEFDFEVAPSDQGIAVWDLKSDAAKAEYVDTGVKATCFAASPDGLWR